MVAVIAFSLFLDYFLYGLLFPLVAHSPAGLKGEGHLALLYGVYAISVLLVTPVFGYLGDRIGGRSTMLCGAALAVCAVSLLGVAPSLSLLLLGKFCQGAASAALWTSGLALIATNYVEKRVEMLGYAFTGGTFGSVIGPIAGGLLYHAGGYRLPFLITGIAFAIAAALIALLVPAGGIQRNEPVDFRALLLNRSLMVPAVAIALAAFSVGIIEPLLPVRLARYGATSMAIGIIFTVSTLVYGLSAPLVGRVSERIPIQKVIVLGTIAMAATLPFLALFKGVILVGITLSLVNICVRIHAQPGVGGTRQCCRSIWDVLLFGSLRGVQHLLFHRNVGHCNARFCRSPIAQLLGCFAVRQRNLAAVSPLSHQGGSAAKGWLARHPMDNHRGLQCAYGEGNS